MFVTSNAVVYEVVGGGKALVHQLTKHVTSIFLQV